MDLQADLRAALRGRVALIGVGNPDLGDDGAGVSLAQALLDRAVPDVLVGERTPERCLGRLLAGRFDSVLLLDAVDAGCAPGAAVLLDAAAIEAGFPQASTHRLGLGPLARLLRAGAGLRVLLLGIQPRTLARGAPLSPEVDGAVGTLAEVLAGLLVRRGESP
jgi:hydrogenase maturation protease